MQRTRLHPVDRLDDPRLDPYRGLKAKSLAGDTGGGLFVAEGRLIVRRLLASRLKVQSVLLAESRVQAFSGQVPDHADVFVVPDALVSQLVGFQFHSGVMACGERHWDQESVVGTWSDGSATEPDRESSGSDAKLRSLRSNLGSDPLPGRFVDRLLVVCCPDLALAENLGSIVRLASGFGARGLVVGPRSIDPFTRRCVRVSMGQLFRLALFRPDDLAGFLERLRTEHGFRLVAAERTVRSVSLASYQPVARTVLLLGNEGRGLEPCWLDMADEVVQIDLADGVDSLNVAVAAGIVMYELTKRTVGWASSLTDVG